MALETATTIAAGTEPAWSPDGRTVAYRNTKGDFVLRHITEQNASKLFSGKDVWTPLQWSPDGRYVMFVGGFGSKGSRTQLPRAEEGHALRAADEEAKIRSSALQVCALLFSLGHERCLFACRRVKGREEVADQSRPRSRFHRLGNAGPGRRDLSAADDPRAILDKVGEYPRAGARLVWVLDPSAAARRCTGP